MGRTQKVRKLKKQRDIIKISSNSEVYYELFKFLSSRGWKNEKRLTVSTFLEGRGLYAKEDLSDNDLIIELPLNCLITISTIEGDQNFIKLFKEENFIDMKQMISFQALLAFYLSYQKTLGKESEWYIYICTLPKEFTMPFFCKKNELYHLPDHIILKIVEQNNAIKMNYQHLINILHEDFREMISLDTFKWAYFVCNSRSVYINSKSIESIIDEEMIKLKHLIIDQPNMALAPMLDLLNHQDEAKTRCQLSHCEKFIEENVQSINCGNINLTYMLFTLKSRKKYEQIFINYGPYNNTKLLVEYGFILRNNRMDFLEFSLDDINCYIKKHLELRMIPIPKHKFKFIKDHALDQQMYIDKGDGLNHNFQVVLAILLSPKNIYNLTQVAFGNDLNFCDIKEHALEIIKQRKDIIDKSLSELKNNIDDLSNSALMCTYYFEESLVVINKVLDLLISI